ncbi:hypothetical protein FisN_8Hh319 [Fistulifera solaris]|uniref:Uncharacterized protein n=1 Tax=Fistulifera solaris TaxID=1519565 RepID=A0A1Z5KHP5_FISSO|nr:hypothetical protein FisN_8Hh319 [Fistulifera solaris]|eukprot:GAX25779.1 hypothetical protein FisN_8Hh319 [Fistulifera solaris]
MGKISFVTSCVAISLMLGSLCPFTLSFVIQSRTFCRTSNNVFQLKSTTDEKSEKEENVTRTSFGQAEASLIEEADRKRLDDMGDFDANPAYKDEKIEKMREAIRARTADLGMERSKVSADYIKNREMQALSGGAQQEREAAASTMFGGIDLSKISTDESSVANRGQWDENTPTMFYDPEEEMSLEERQEVDPVMMKNPIEQTISELSGAKWPTVWSAGREVLIMFAVVAFSCLLIIGADNLLRQLYTAVGFIPSKEDIANYASRFDGLDLPPGWMNNMNEQDVAKLAEQVNSVPTNLPSL